MGDLKATNNLPPGSHNIAINSYSSTGNNVKIVQMMPNMHSNQSGISMIIPNASSSPSYSNTNHQFSGESASQQSVYQKKSMHESVATSSSSHHSNDVVKNLHPVEDAHRYIQQSPVFTFFKLSLMFFSNRFSDPTHPRHRNGEVDESLQILKRPI